MSPTLIAYGALALAIICEVTGSSLLQKSEQFSRLIPTLAMALCFVAALFFLSQALKLIPLGVAYAIWAGLGIVLTSLVSVFVFRFTLDAAALAGIALIVSGVVVMNVFSNSVAH
ncbi:DMT family transporter [Mesorhizobium shangrilense]|uniref:Multidrug efflux SMR transporter n=1 Tax=Mesorhizobium shangrilense TaxID=460060 RepID=A0ABV2D6K5_9HYPH